MNTYNSTQIVKRHGTNSHKWDNQYLITYLPATFSHSSNEANTSFSEYHITLSIQHSNSDNPTIVTFSLSSSQDTIELTYPSPNHSHTVHHIPHSVRFDPIPNEDVLSYFDNFIQRFLSEHIREIFKMETPFPTTTTYPTGFSLTSYNFPK